MLCQEETEQVLDAEAVREQVEVWAEGVEVLAGWVVTDRVPVRVESVFAPTAELLFPTRREFLVIR